MPYGLSNHGNIGNSFTNFHKSRSGVTGRKMPKHYCHLVDTVGVWTDFILICLKTSENFPVGSCSCVWAISLIWTSISFRNIQEEAIKNGLKESSPLSLLLDASDTGAHLTYRSLQLTCAKSDHQQLAIPYTHPVHQLTSESGRVICVSLKSR